LILLHYYIKHKLHANNSILKYSGVYGFLTMEEYDQSANI